MRERTLLNIRRLQAIATRAGLSCDRNGASFS
jgi:hypothetical protein